MIVRILFIGILFFWSETIFAQTDPSWIFNDSNGNVLTIENIDSLPDDLDTLIFKDEKIVEQIVDSNRQWKVVIVEVKRIKKNKIYDLKLIKIPLNATIEEVLKYKGYSHYECRIKKTKNELTEIISIKYSSGEI